MYRRRRAVALVVVLAAVSLVVFCVYSLGRGVADGVSLLRPTPIAVSYTHLTLPTKA